MFGYQFYVDTSRCIGCQACVKACEECETHRGVSMINFDYLDRPNTIATAALVCFHCEDPTCAVPRRSPRPSAKESAIDAARNPSGVSAVNPTWAPASRG